ncbi:sigma factor [Lysinibacillus sp. D3C2_S12]|uniref:RNA polymerase sigma factor n=1 Tax=Lysinibacillus sp. D3C2_S12 TaxID=2941226 RepID=UPI0020C13DF6|nr:sigma factor [Lysinibacillus sp. D3C2_S12]
MSEHLAAIMEEHGEYCLRVASLYVKDWTIAEEIVQDVFFAYYRQQNLFEQRSSLKTYLVKAPYIKVMIIYEVGKTNDIY